MRYTRYDLKNKKKENAVFILILVLILVGAVGIGSIVSHIFIKGSSENIKQQEANKVNSTQVNVNKDKNVSLSEYITLQCGVFSKKENADQLMGMLNKIGTPFIVQEEEKYKVIFGIYSSSEDAAKAEKLLTDNKFSVNRVRYQLNRNNTCDLELINLINAYKQVLDKLSDKSVKAYRTTNLKNWVKKLANVNDKEKNVQVLKEMKDYIDKLPDEISRDKADESKIFLYNILRKINK